MKKMLFLLFLFAATMSAATAFATTTVEIERSRQVTVVGEYEGNVPFKEYYKKLQSGDVLHVTVTHKAEPTTHSPMQGMMSPPSVVEIMSAIADTHRLAPSGVQVMYHITDTTGEWVMTVGDSGFVATVVDFMSSDDATDYAALAGSALEQENLFIDLGVGKEFFLALKAAQRQPSEKAAADYTAAAAKLGIEVERVL